MMMMIAVVAATMTMITMNVAFCRCQFSETVTAAVCCFNLNDYLLA